MKHIYWGMGKGKTSALNGSAVRAKGAGFKVIVCRFLKGRETSEDKMLEKLDIPVFKFHGSSKFVVEMSPEEILLARSTAKNALNFIQMNANKYDMIVLDEILDLAASNVRFFTDEDLLLFFNSLPKEKEVLISGHTFLPKVFESVDLITKFEAVKHYFEKGINARKGIEF